MYIVKAANGTRLNGYLRLTEAVFGMVNKIWHNQVKFFAREEGLVNLN